MLQKFFEKLMMGAFFAKALEKLIGKKQKKILIVGLTQSGKTTILYRLKTGKVVSTSITTFPIIETIEYKNISFTMYDMGGNDGMRKMWHHQYSTTDGIIFVIDSDDREMIDDSSGRDYTAKEELFRMLACDELRDALLLILANKQDLPNAMCMDEIIERLGLQTLRRHQWHVQSTSAINGDGLYQGLDWLCNSFNKQK